MVKFDVDRKLIDDTFLHAMSSRRDVYHSELYASGAQKRGYVNLASQNSLLGLMEVFALTFRELPLPKTMWTAQDRARFREIFVKVRGVTLVKNIGRQFDRFGRFSSEANKCRMGQAAAEVIDPLRADLGQALTRIQEIDRKGKAEAQADRQTVLRLGRVRQELPNSNLSDEDIRFLSVWLGGFSWRNRGGGPIREKGTQNARLYHAYLPFKNLAYLAGAYNLSDNVGNGHFIRLVRHGWGKSMDMGLSSNTIEEDTIGMTNRGLLQVSDVAGDFHRSGFDGALVRLGGAQMGPCYNYSAERLSQITIHPHPAVPFERGFIEGFTAWGEFCTGMTIALGQTEALLKGRIAGGYQTQQFGAMNQQNSAVQQQTPTTQRTPLLQQISLFQQNRQIPQNPQPQQFQQNAQLPTNGQSFRIPSIPRIPSKPQIPRIPR
jgi:hypothetical protein